MHAYCNPTVLPISINFDRFDSFIKSRIVHNKEIKYASDVEGPGIEIRAGLTLRYWDTPQRWGWRTDLFSFVLFFRGREQKVAQSLTYG